MVAFTGEAVLSRRIICNSIGGVPYRKELASFRTDPTSEGLHEQEDRELFPSVKKTEKNTEVYVVILQREF